MVGFFKMFRAEKQGVAALLAAILLSACATPEPPKPPPGTPQGQRALDMFVSLFTGNWDPRPGEPAERLRVLEFWKGSTVRWLYLEWVSVADESKPIRQVVLRIAERGEDHRMVTTFYRLPGGRMRYAGEWRKPDAFASLRATDLVEVEACRMKTWQGMDSQYVIMSDGRKCPSDRGPHPFTRYTYSITSSELELREEPNDATGNVVGKIPVDPFQFGRMSRDPR